VTKEPRFTSYAAVEKSRWKEASNNNWALPESK